MEKKYYKKWMKIILYIEKCTPKDIAYTTNTPLSGVYGKTKWFKEQGWTKVKKVGIRNEILLTEKGKEVYEACHIILKELDELQTNIKYKRTKLGDLYEKI